MKHRRRYILQVKAALEPLGYAVAVSNDQDRWQTTLRVYASPRHKGNPDLALYATSIFNRYTLTDAKAAVGQ